MLIAGHLPGLPLSIVIFEVHGHNVFAGPDQANDKAQWTRIVMQDFQVYYGIVMQRAGMWHNSRGPDTSAQVQGCALFSHGSLRSCPVSTTHREPQWSTIMADALSISKDLLEIGKSILDAIEQVSTVFAST